ncbi:hypothetical protein FRC20_005972 [Serendipita sp. 405]|nr:hypothetical protein FRC20_005972 [Serendipita sp. 405]
MAMILSSLLVPAHIARSGSSSPSPRLSFPSPWFGIKSTALDRRSYLHPPSFTNPNQSLSSPSLSRSSCLCLPRVPLPDCPTLLRPTGLPDSSNTSYIYHKNKRSYPSATS